MGDSLNQITESESVNRKNVYKKHKSLVLMGRKWRFLWSNSDGSQRYACCREHCQSRVTVNFVNDQIKVKEGSMGLHNPAVCTFDTTLQGRTDLTEKFLNALKARISTESPALLFNRMRNEYRTEDIGGLRYDDVKSKVKKIKSKIFPPRPSTLKEFGALLQAEGKDMLRYDDGEGGSQMLARVITVGEKSWSSAQKKKGYPLEQTDEPESTIIVIADPKFVKKLLKTKELAADIYTDGTFSISMNELELCQTYIIQIGAYNQAWPIAYCLMERKTSESYESLLRYIFDELAPELKNLNVKAHMDFEAAVHTTIKNHFSWIEIIACLFHFVQAQNKQSNKKGALNDFKKKVDEETEEIKNRKKELKEVLRLVQVIPYLPAEKIDSQLLLSLKNRLDSTNQKTVEKYFDYFDKNWINSSIWPPKTWSIYNQDVTTNNFSESRNKNMTLYFGRHPYPWVFAERLTVYQAKVVRDFASEKKPRPISNNSKKKVYVRGCERELQEGLQRIEFLEKIAAWKNENQIRDQNFEYFASIVSDDDEEVESATLENDTEVHVENKQLKKRQVSKKVNESPKKRQRVFSEIVVPRQTRASSRLRNASK